MLTLYFLFKVHLQVMVVSKYGTGIGEAAIRVVNIEVKT